VIFLAGPDGKSGREFHGSLGRGTSFAMNTLSRRIRVPAAWRPPRIVSRLVRILSCTSITYQHSTPCTLHTYEYATAQYAHATWNKRILRCHKNLIIRLIPPILPVSVPVLKGIARGLRRSTANYLGVIGWRESPCFSNSEPCEEALDSCR
jgi:hypothetical protein